MYGQVWRRTTICIIQPRMWFHKIGQLQTKFYVFTTSLANANLVNNKTAAMNANKISQCPN